MGAAEQIDAISEEETAKQGVPYGRADGRRARLGSCSPKEDEHAGESSQANYAAVVAGSDDNSTW